MVRGQGLEKDCGVGALSSRGCAAWRAWLRGKDLTLSCALMLLPQAKSSEHRIFCEESGVSPWALAWGFSTRQENKEENWACVGEGSGRGPGQGDGQS